MSETDEAATADTTATADIGDTRDTGDTTERTREELLTQLELLEAENQALYDSYVRAKQSQYRRTAIGLGALGALAVVGALAVPSAQQILLALAGIGLFGGILTLYLTPERFIAADTGRDVYAALASNEAAIVAELGLTDHRVYVPTPDADQPVRLFVPHVEEYALPEADALADTIIAPAESDRRGVAFEPSGGRLFESFTRALSGELGDTPAALGTQLTDALTAQFELVETAEAAVDATGEGLTVTVTDVAYGPPTRFDHPVASVVAVGLARGLETPVTVTVAEADDDRYDYRLRYGWERDDE